MLLSSTSFQYALFDESFSRVEELCHVTIPGGVALQQPDVSRLAFLLDNFSLRGLKCQRSYVSVLAGDFALLPASFSEQVKGADALRFALGTYGRAQSTRLAAQGVDICLSTSEEVFQEIERSFSTATVMHAGAATISLFFSHHALRSYNFFLNLHDGCIEIACKKRDQLLFYNTYAVSGTEDVLYYLLFLAQEHGFQGKDIRVAIGGLAEAQGIIHKQLSRYCGEVSMVSNDPSVYLPASMSSLPSHQYFTLLNQHLCAS